MRSAGFIVLGFELGTAFASLYLRTGGTPWVQSDEAWMLVTAIGVGLVLYASSRGPIIGPIRTGDRDENRRKMMEGEHGTH